MTKREFLTAGIGAGLALAERTAAFSQTAGRTSSRKAKTTKLFKSPQGFPNGIAVTPEGLWIGEQKLSGAQAVSYHLPEPKDLTEASLARRLEWQAAEDRDHSFAKHERDGRGRRICLDGAPMHLRKASFRWT